MNKKLEIQVREYLKKTQYYKTKKRIRIQKKRPCRNDRALSFSFYIVPNMNGFIPPDMLKKLRDRFSLYD